MAEGAEPTPASNPVTDETADKAEETPSAAESSSKGTEESSSGEKRKTDDETNTDPTPAENKPKKAKIAMPPSVSSSVTNVEKYTLESPPPEDNTNEADVTKKITTANLMLFGLHPLIKASPLQKMLEDYGTVKAITVRSAFASRYGHVSFETVEEARRCYVAIHGAKLLHKTFLVQPSAAVVKASPTTGSDDKSSTAAETAGAAAAAAAVTTTASA